MRELTMVETEQVSGGGNVEICQVGSGVIGGVVGGVLGAYGTFGFGTGLGASWGAWLGGAAGTLWCSTFFA